MSSSLLLAAEQQAYSERNRLSPLPFFESGLKYRQRINHTAKKTDLSRSPLWTEIQGSPDPNWKANITHFLHSFEPVPKDQQNPKRPKPPDHKPLQGSFLRHAEDMHLITNHSKTRSFDRPKICTWSQITPKLVFFNRTEDMHLITNYSEARFLHQNRKMHLITNYSAARFPRQHGKYAPDNKLLQSSFPSTEPKTYTCIPSFSSPPSLFPRPKINSS